MPQNTRDAFLAQTEKVIVANAGPLDHLTEESLSWLSDYLATEATQGGVTLSRSEWFETDKKLKKSFFKRLALFGHLALNAAMNRHQESVERGEKVRDLLALELPDLLEAEPKVATLSGTVFCTPDVPGD